MIILEAINYKTYETRINRADYEHIIKHDPSPTKEYACWMIEKYLKLNDEKKKSVLHHYSTLSLLHTQLTNYDYFKKRNVIPKEYKDINSFQSYSVFFEWVDENYGKLELLVMKKDAKKNTKVLYKDDGHIVVIPLTYEVARKYGTHTAWCTSTETKEHYTAYSKNGTLYINRFLNPDGSFNLEEAYQLYIPNEGAFSPYNTTLCTDKKDITVDINKFFTGIKDQELVEDLTKKAVKGTEEFLIKCKFEVRVQQNVLLLDTEFYLALKNQGGQFVPYSSDTSCMSHIQMWPIGKDVPPNPTFPDEYNSYKDIDFNYFNGKGLLIMYGSDPTITIAEENSRRIWPNATMNAYNNLLVNLLERPHSYFYNRAYRYDYVIVKNYGVFKVLDRVLYQIIKEYLNFSIHDTHAFQTRRDEDNNCYSIYFNDYDYIPKIKEILDPLKYMR